MFPIRASEAQRRYCPVLSKDSGTYSLCLGANCAFWRYFERTDAQIIGGTPPEPRVTVVRPRGVDEPEGICLLVPTTRTDLTIGFPAGPR